MTIPQVTVRAISLDLDDTLWPIAPTILRAEGVLRDWLQAHAPATAALMADRVVAQSAREHIQQRFADHLHDFTLLRRESIRHLLTLADEDPALAEPAFDAFFAARQQVTFYEDALPALETLSRHFPLVALTNGNADLARVGLASLFSGCISARVFGVPKPHPSIYAAAAQAAGVAAAEMLHVGDDPHLDVVGALEAGQQAAWINREDREWPESLQPLVSDALHLRDLNGLVAALGL